MVISVEANTLGPALAELKAMGFEVERVGGAYRARRGELVLRADDMLQLLWLALLVERRGTAVTMPTDAEVAELLRLYGVG